LETDKTLGPTLVQIQTRVNGQWQSLIVSNLTIGHQDGIMHEQSVDLTNWADSTDHLPRDLAELFWLAQVFTGDDNAALALVLKAIDFRPVARRTIIEAACNFLSPQIKSAAREFSHEIDLCDVRAAQTNCLTLNFETLSLALLKMNLLLRFVWVLRLAEGYSTMETARLLNVEPLVVKKALTAAMIRLASIFQSQS
jgi:hypothetical protein